MTHTYALLRLGAAFYGHVLASATELPPVDRAEYFADAKRTLDVLAAELTKLPGTQKSKPPAERP